MSALMSSDQFDQIRRSQMFTSDVTVRKLLDHIDALRDQRGRQDLALNDVLGAARRVVDLNRATDDVGLGDWLEALNLLEETFGEWLQTRGQT